MTGSSRMSIGWLLTGMLISLQAQGEPQSFGVAVSQVPVSQVPVTQVPVTQVPVTQVPVTQVPVTQVPVAQVPVAKVPQNHLFNRDAMYWKQQHELRLKGAAQSIVEEIRKKNAELKKSGKSFYMALTPVYGHPVPPPLKTPIPSGVHVPPSGWVPQIRQGNCRNPAITAQATDSRVDMSDFGLVTLVRDQDEPRPCGSCWAFATVAALETASLLRNGGDPSALHLSAAQVTRCTSFLYPSFDSCYGGFQQDAAGYAHDHGIVEDATWSYVAWNAGDATRAENRCDALSNNSSPFRVERWGYAGRGGIAIPIPSRDDIKRAIIQFGSVAAAMQATATFLGYGGGIYDANDNTTLITNHVVQIIGWNDEHQAWLIKNSWNSRWGEGGFGWIRYDTNLIGSYAIWVLAQDTPGNSCPSNVPSIAASGSATDHLGYYQHHIQTRQSNLNLVVEVNDAITGPDRGHKVQQYHHHGPSPLRDGDGHNQEWWFIASGTVNGQPVFRMLNRGYDRFLTELNGGVTAEPGNGNSTQLWFIEKVAAEDYVIKNVQSGRALQAPTGNNNDEAALSTGAFTGAQNQKFGIESTRVNSGLREGPKFLVPKYATDMAVDLPAGNPSSPFQIYRKMDHNGNQMFSLVYDSGRGHFQIQKSANGAQSCFDVTGASRGDSATIELQPCSPSADSQAWYLLPEARDGGRYIVINKNSGKSLDVLGARHADRTPVVQQEFADGDSQRWEVQDWR